MKHALITTTINIPILLDDYCKDFIAHKHDVEIIVAGDKKTPLEAAAYCAELQTKYKLSVRYLTPQMQTIYLDSWPLYRDFLPWNCIQRRNVAILMAYFGGADIIYTIDDDNFLDTPNYIGSHMQAMAHCVHTVIDQKSGWFNPLALAFDAPFPPRGFSFRNRRLNMELITGGKQDIRIVVNAGLWLGEPDIDAVTRMALAPLVTDQNLPFHLKPLVLGKGTKCPFNSQNTALHRDVIPAYCLATGTGRYDDIVASYIVKRIADHLGDYISFGLPLVMQIRNAHNVWQDLHEEIVGMQIIDDFVDWLYSIELSQTSYRDCTGELLSMLKTKCGSLQGDKRAFMESLCRNYEIWLDIFT